MLSHTLKLIWRMSPFCDSMCVYPLYLASSRLKRLSILRDPCGTCGPALWPLWNLTQSLMHPNPSVALQVLWEQSRRAS